MNTKTNVVFILTVLFCCGCANKSMPKVKVSGVNKESVFEAAKQPIYSVNLIKKEIPENLRNLSVIYQAPNSCAEYWQELELLDLALGEDLTDKSDTKKDAFTVHLGQLLTDEVESNIPFNSLIKRLSGARKHEKKRRSAKLKGKTRRSYLKGWAEGMQCESVIEPDVDIAPLVDLK